MAPQRMVVESTQVSPGKTELSGIPQGGCLSWSHWDAPTASHPYRHQVWQVCGLPVPAQQNFSHTLALGKSNEAIKRRLPVNAKAELLVLHIYNYSTVSQL